MCAIETIVAREILVLGVATRPLRSTSPPPVASWSDRDVGDRPASSVSPERCDGDKTRYLGKGVTKASMASVNEPIAGALGMDVTKQAELDAKMNALDGTLNKSKYGANAICLARRWPPARRRPRRRACRSTSGLPRLRATRRSPSGAELQRHQRRRHAGNARVPGSMIPVGAESFKEAMRIGCEVPHAQGHHQEELGGDATLIGDEGGFAPPCDARHGRRADHGGDREGGLRGQVQGRHGRRRLFLMIKVLRLW